MPSFKVVVFLSQLSQNYVMGKSSSSEYFPKMFYNIDHLLDLYILQITAFRLS